VKRAIHIVFWLSLVAVALVFLLRRGEKDQTSSVTQAHPSLAGSATAPTLGGGLPPPKLVRPDGGSATPAEPEPVDPRVAAELALMKQLRDNYRSDTAKAIAAGREARKQFADSRFSDERDSLLIQAYVNSGDLASARAEMPNYYREHPHGRWADYLFVLTNVGPNSP